MGRAQQKRGPADPLADQLRWFFQESEADLGVASSFGGFVNLAMSGIQGGGRSNGVECRAVAIADWGATTAHRRLRARLQQLGERAPRLLEVLWAAYGPFDWPRIADAAFGRGTGERLVRALGADRIGVALLTERLAQTHADEIGPELEVSDGMNRWVLATITRAGEPLYRCAGPLVSVYRALREEPNEELRARALRKLGGEDTVAGALVAGAAGTDLDAVIGAHGIARNFWEEQIITERPPAAPTPPRGRAGVLLVDLVLAAYPTSPPRKAKQKARTAAALRQVTAIRDEAVMLLQRARDALPASEHLLGRRRDEERPGRPGTKPSPRERWRAARDVRRSRPVQVYPAIPELASEALLG